MQLSDGSVAEIVAGPSGPTVIIKTPRAFEFGPMRGSGYVSPFACYIPHTAVHPLTVKGAPDNAVWVDVSTSNFAYYGALAHWWAQGETFMVLEHDVTCREDIVESFDACPEPWCLYEYDPVCPCGNPNCREAWRNALGCTRYRKELIAAVPDALLKIPKDNWDWHEVCNGLGDNLRAAGFKHHWHEGPVKHHRMVQRDGLDQYQ